ncbi:MAG TPA: GNAT family N-acetyltransferase [Desulfoprunum sp.]|nr:GNAT family N-acetyltransferase [Desulfoprunum sp.]
MAKKSDIEEIYDVINDAAIAYKGKIPEDRWHEPYMSKKELQEQIEDGVIFSCYIEKEKIVGVMGVQDKADVDLIRHAYVRTNQRKNGIGSILLKEIIQKTKKPVLIGTWKNADWAIKF